MNVFVWAGVAIFLWIVILYVFGSKSREMDKFSKWLWQRVWIGGWWLIPGLFLILDLYDMVDFEAAIISILVCTVIYIIVAYMFFRKYFPNGKEKIRKNAIKEWKKKQKW